MARSRCARCDYADEVLHGTATYDHVIPSADAARASWQARLDAGHPALIAMLDDHVVGYAHAGRYRPREGYRFTVETASMSRHPRAAKASACACSRR